MYSCCGVSARNHLGSAGREGSGNLGDDDHQLHILHAEEASKKPVLPRKDGSIANAMQDKPAVMLGIRLEEQDASHVEASKRTGHPGVVPKKGCLLAWEERWVQGTLRRRASKVSSTSTG
jgi:hypothetical protein